ncbi:uncharacterized protein OCT59_024820 [Rhizophagus irregularis]|uniref:uncharacterized protein n=1 Tax=Rhizophagus irregularis TaxID=588596 RepID=UPI0033316160|nr:hypothetical protein OCT59_024820 [Rhizophagus irregularis]
MEALVIDAEAWHKDANTNLRSLKRDVKRCITESTSYEKTMWERIETELREINVEDLSFDHPICSGVLDIKSEPFTNMPGSVCDIFKELFQKYKLEQNHDVMEACKEFIQNEKSKINVNEILSNINYGEWLDKPEELQDLTKRILESIADYMMVAQLRKNAELEIVYLETDTQHPNSPGFLCFSEENRSGVYSSPTEAINTCYEKVFRSNVKFPGPQVMGFDNSNIIQQLLDDIIFHPYMISLRKLNVIVLEMGKSKKLEWNYAGEGYKSVFQSHYNGIKSAFIQEIEDEECVVQIYTNDTLIRTYNAIDPDEVWLCIGRLSNYSGK